MRTAATLIDILIRIWNPLFHWKFFFVFKIQLPFWGIHSCPSFFKQSLISLMICLPNKCTLNHEVKRGLFVFFITKKLIGMSVRKCKMANGLLWTHVGPKNKLCNDYITVLDCGLAWSSVFGIKTILTLAATLALTKEKRKSRWMSQTLAHIICE